MKVILDRLVENALGCISKNSKHCNRKPLQSTASPENTARQWRRQMQQSWQVQVQHWWREWRPRVLVGFGAADPCCWDLTRVLICFSDVTLATFIVPYNFKLLFELYKKKLLYISQTNFVTVILYFTIVNLFLIKSALHLTVVTIYFSVTSL